MVRRVTASAVAALIAATSLTVAASPAVQAAPRDTLSAAQAANAVPPASSLLSVTVEDGTLRRVSPGRFVLAVTPEGGAITWFTDRPQRRAGHFAAERLVGMWPRLGFAADSPEAALLTETDDGQRSQVLELSRPRWADGQLVFDARLRGGSRATGSFTSGSLFIDGTSDCPTLASAQQQAAAVASTFAQLQPLIISTEQAEPNPNNGVIGVAQSMAQGAINWLPSINQATTVSQVTQALSSGASAFLPYEIAQLRFAQDPDLNFAISSLNTMQLTSTILLAQWQGC